MPMTSLWCFSIKRFGTQFAGAELFFSMKPFYPINRVLSAHRARHGRPFIHSPVRRLMGCQLGCGCAALGSLRLRARLLLAVRQREYEPAAFPDFALDPDPSAMQFNKLLGQR